MTRNRPVMVGPLRIDKAIGEIATWNQLVVQRQAARGRVMVPGRFLSGNEVSDDPMLVRAKLKNLLAPMPPGHLQPLTEAYRSAEAASRHVATLCSRCLSCPCERPSPTPKGGALVTTISHERARSRDDELGVGRPLTIEDVARYLGVSERWIYEQVRSGRLPAMLIARSWRLRQEAVDEFAESFSCPVADKMGIRNHSL
jgi:excisionase family DNA binding protein